MLVATYNKLPGMGGIIYKNIIQKIIIYKNIIRKIISPQQILEKVDV
jgi:hypothetical protein